MVFYIKFSSDLSQKLSKGSVEFSSFCHGDNINVILLFYLVATSLKNVDQGLKVDMKSCVWNRGVRSLSCCHSSTG